MNKQVEVSQTFSSSNILDPNRPRYSLSELLKTNPPNVPFDKKEFYLSDIEFKQVFKMKMEEYS